MVNIVVVHAHKQEREKIISLFSSRGEIKVLGSGEDGYDALKIVSSLKPDIALIDNQLDYIKGSEITPLIRLRSPSTAVVLLTAEIDNYQLYRAAVNEVAGFVYIKTDLDFLPEILKCVSRGEGFISPGFAARVLQLISVTNEKNFCIKGQYTGKIPVKITKKTGMRPNFSIREDPVGFLSKMELQILTYIGEGHSSAEIAEKLGLTLGTLRNYISALLNKTGLKNRPQLVRYAMDYGLIHS